MYHTLRTTSSRPAACPAASWVPRQSAWSGAPAQTDTATDSQPWPSRVAAAAPASIMARSSVA